MNSLSAATRRPMVPGWIACLALIASCASPEHTPAPASNADSSADTAPASAIQLPYRGHGTEPFWDIHIRPDSMVFGGISIEPVAVPTPTIETIEGGWRYAGAGGFTVTILDQIGDDGMGDMEYPNQVVVQVGGKEYRGCGGDPATLLTGGEWTVTRIDTTAVVAGSTVTIQFDSEGRVSGNASCNRYSGQYSLSGEGIKFSPLASTKMACAEQDRNEQETRFLDLLQRTRYFAIPAKGSLELHVTDDRPSIVARR